MIHLRTSKKGPSESYPVRIFTYDGPKIVYWALICQLNNIITRSNKKAHFIVASLTKWLRTTFENQSFLLQICLIFRSKRVPLFVCAFLPSPYETPDVI